MRPERTAWPERSAPKRSESRVATRRSSPTNWSAIRISNPNRADTAGSAQDQFSASMVVGSRAVVVATGYDGRRFVTAGAHFDGGLPVTCGPPREDRHR